MRGPWNPVVSKRLQNNSGGTVRTVKGMIAAAVAPCALSALLAAGLLVTQGGCESRTAQADKDLQKTVEAIPPSVDLLSDRKREIDALAAAANSQGISDASKRDVKMRLALAEVAAGDVLAHQATALEIEAARLVTDVRA